MTKYIICLSCLILVLSGCGKSPEEKILEEQIEAATGADAEIDLSNERMNISGKTEDGSFSISSGEGTDVPENFPSDVLVYKPSKVQATMDMPQGHSLTLSTTDDGKKVQDAYKSEMTSKGWSEQASINMGSRSMLTYKKEDRVAQITISPSDNETQILVIVGED
jgi:hypothetical protein